MKVKSSCSIDIEGMSRSRRNGQSHCVIDTPSVEMDEKQNK